MVDAYHDFDRTNRILHESEGTLLRTVCFVNLINFSKSLSFCLYCSHEGGISLS